MLTQVLGTLAGVAFGGAIAFYATFATERAKWSRAQSVRWDERRLSVYVAYLNSVRRMHMLSGRIAVSRNLSADYEPLSVDEGIPLLIEADLERSSRWQEVLLLGGSTVIEIGTELNRCTWTLEWFARGKVTDSDDWRLVARESYLLRRRFVDEARKDMGVTALSVTTPDSSYGWMPDQLLPSLREQEARTAAERNSSGQS